MKLVESSGTYTGYVSTDDVTWTEIASVSIPAISTTSFYAQLAADSDGLAGGWPFNQIGGSFANVYFDSNQVLTGPGNPYLGTPGSWSNNGSLVGTMAFDDSVYTSFVGPDASGDWCGQDLGVPCFITSLGIAPQPGYEYRMNGGKMQAATESDFGDAVTLYTIPSNPSDGLTSIPVPANLQGPYRYVRYVGPTNGYCNVAEAEFDGTPVVVGTAGATELTGLPTNSYVGTSGSWGSNPDLVGAMAFDNSLGSYFNGPDSSGDWCGQNLNVPALVTSIQFAGLTGYTSRMVYGEFQGSVSDPTFTTGVTTLYTVTSTPPDGLNTVQIPTSLQGPYQYVRFIQPSNWCTVEEADYYGFPNAP